MRANLILRLNGVTDMFVSSPFSYSSSSNHKSALSLSLNKNKIYKLHSAYNNCKQTSCKFLFAVKHILKKKTGYFRIFSSTLRQNVVCVRKSRIPDGHRRVSGEGGTQFAIRRDCDDTPRMNQKKREKLGPVSATWFKAKYYDRTHIPATSPVKRDEGERHRGMSRKSCRYVGRGLLPGRRNGRRGGGTLI